VDGRRLTFHLAGVYNGSYLIADHETNTYWTPFTGEALEGPLKGKRLPQIPLVQCRWKQWVKLYPQGMIAAEPARWRQGRGSTRPPIEARVGNFLQLLLKPLDQRLDVHERVFGVSSGDKSRVYPLSTLDAAAGPGKTVVVNDTLGKEKIVILHQRETLLTTAFSRRLGRKTMQFTTDEDRRVIDSIYHSHWNYEGEAVDGAVVGQKLSPVESQSEDWYIWAAYHPATSIFGNELDKNH
jgi:hypothetical protein